MKLSFGQGEKAQTYRQPAPTVIPQLPQTEVSALYRGARVGGDYYEFLTAGHGRLVFGLFDIAGERGQALHVAAAMQEFLRQRVPELFRDQDINEANALTDLMIELNRVILKAAAGVRHTPAFLGCYNEPLGTLTYINAGHTPALVMNAGQITEVEANGIPLGLFSHATHEPGITVIPPGAALVLVSRGVVETRNGFGEFGMERVLRVLNSGKFQHPSELCSSMLNAVADFAGGNSGRFSLKDAIGDVVEMVQQYKPNDTTVVALMRKP